MFTNLGVLGFFKYANFFLASFTDLLTSVELQAHPFTLRVLLPVGISFYTFQALSYTIDVYRRRLPAVNDPVAYFSFITFFPHMVAGPIQQAKHLLVQLECDRHFERSRATDGARQMLWGFFKKMVIADNLAGLVSAPYADPSSADGWVLLWATYCFAFQIYCDFSGYTDIAIGCATDVRPEHDPELRLPLLLAIRPRVLAALAHHPLKLVPRLSIHPAWRQPCRALAQGFNVVIVFAVSGFWHGANWTFVIWGLLHASFFLAYTHLARQDKSTAEEAPGGQSLLPAPRAVLEILLTFHLVCLAWVFFRADSVGDALLILRKIGGRVLSGHFINPGGKSAVALVVPLLAVEWAGRRHTHPINVDPLPRPLRWAIYYSIVAAILLFASVNYTPFIYFQF